MYLNCHSHYSLRFGTLSIEALVQTAKACDVGMLALTDINATTGVYDFILECGVHDIKPVIGVDFRNGSDQCFIALAKNREGFREINECLSKHNKDKTALPDIAPPWHHCFVIYPFEKQPQTLRDFEYIGVRKNQLNRLRTSTWMRYLDRVVMHHPVTHQGGRYFHLHATLCAVDQNILLSKLRKESVADRRDVMIKRTALREGFEDFPQIIKTSKYLLEQCNFTFDFRAPKNKKNYTKSNANDKELLRKLAYAGMERRYGLNNKEAKRRIEKEIRIIDTLDFAGYYLITWDIIKYSMSRGFYHVGRGSGANSIVSYCLGITNICPIELNLYFERFLNPARTKPPDFDIDWSWQTRDEILDYIFTRFDDGHVAFCGTTGTFKHRSIMRELGKVYGLPKEELDVLSKNPISAQGKNKVVSKIQNYAQMLAGFPNMRSMHACGILISEEPLTYYTALDMPPKGFPVAQFDMYTAEEISFDKLDILSQRGLGHIDDSLKLIRRNQNKEVDIHAVTAFKDDPAINEKLSKGRTLGAFYIESPAMRGLLRRLKCNNYNTLVAASSIIRPGVAKSGMMREYIFRHNNPDKFEYFHKVFEDQLKDTFGVMVYQEDVIKIAHHFAGLDFADADILRRSMTGKARTKKEFERVREKYFANCKSRGYPEKLTKEVYRQIESFAGFSFCKAHSASYSIESYQSLFLKTYYPLEFAVAVINNFGGFYRTEVYAHEARMSGGVVHPPCINRSEILTTLSGSDIYLGLGLVHNLAVDVLSSIMAERERNGTFKDLEDFIERIALGVESVQTLILAGALRFTRKEKSALILQARMFLAGRSKHKPAARLFIEPPKRFTLPEMKRNMFEDAYDELELIGFPVSVTPFDLLKTSYRGAVMVKDLIRHQGKIVKMLGYLISRKNVPTKQGNMNFGTWIDVEGQYFDTTHFVQCLRRYPFTGGGCYLLLGKVDVDFGFPSVEIEKMARMPFISDPRYEEDGGKIFDIKKYYREDYSGTQRKPYPQEQEIGLPRHKMSDLA